MLRRPHLLAAMPIHPPTARKTALMRATAIRSVRSYLPPMLISAPPGFTSERQAWDWAMREHIGKQPTGIAPLKPTPSSATGPIRWQPSKKPVATLRRRRLPTTRRNGRRTSFAATATWRRPAYVQVSIGPCRCARVVGGGA